MECWECSDSSSTMLSPEGRGALERDVLMSLPSALSLSGFEGDRCFCSW